MAAHSRGVSYHLGRFLGWCLFGWRAKPAPRTAAAQAVQAPAFSESVVRAYGRFLEALPGGPLDIYDEAELPYPKWQIALELLEAIRGTPPSQVRSALETGLLQLADFQPRIGKTLKSPSTRIAEVAQAGHGLSVEELARAIAATSDADHDRRYQTVRRYADAEASWYVSLVR